MGGTERQRERERKERRGGVLAFSPCQKLRHSLLRVEGFVKLFEVSTNILVRGGGMPLACVYLCDNCESSVSSKRPSRERGKWLVRKTGFCTQENNKATKPTRAKSR